MRTRSWLLAVFGIFALLFAACETVPPLPQQPPVPNYPPITKPVPPPIEPEAPKIIEPYTPFHLEGKKLTRIGLLLPFSSGSASVRSQAAHMMQASQLAMFTHAGNNFLLMPFDTKGTYSGAQQAAADAAAGGVELLIGPMLSDALHGVRPIAARYELPVISFSTDESQAGHGVYLLNFTAESDLDRVVRHLSRQGVSRYALLAPTTNYGQSAGAALDRITAKYGGFVVARAFYGNSSEEANNAAKELAAQKSLFEAVLIPESAGKIREIAPLLPYHGIDIGATTLFGTSLWNNASIERESALIGSLFPAPDPQIRIKFEQDYMSVYGKKPSRLASLAHDATAIAAFLAQRKRRQPFARNALVTPDGFIGVDGLLRFRPDGQVQRELSVIRIERDGFQTVEKGARHFSNDPYYRN